MDTKTLKKIVGKKNTNCYIHCFTKGCHGYLKAKPLTLSFQPKLSFMRLLRWCGGDLYFQTFLS